MQLFKGMNYLLSAILIFTSVSAIAKLELNLDLTDNAPVSHFTDEDWQLLKAKAKEVLDNNRNGVSSFWSNPQSGHTGSIKAIGDTVESDDTICRKLEFINKITNSVTTTQTTICKQRGGMWEEIVGRQNASQAVSAEGSNKSSILFNEEAKPAQNNVKVFSGESAKCEELAAKVKQYKGQILKRSAAQDRYTAECQR